MTLAVLHATSWRGLCATVALLTVACAYHNPTEPTPAPQDETAPYNLSLEALSANAGGLTLITAHVQTCADGRWQVSRSRSLPTRGPCPHRQSRQLLPGLPRQP
jgi:hypothetical protein